MMHVRPDQSVKDDVMGKENFLVSILPFDEGYKSTGAFIMICMFRKLIYTLYIYVHLVAHDNYLKHT